MDVGTDRKTHRHITISVASGKGGTGKTTTAAMLGILFASLGDEVILLDCDVDEPNLHLVLDCVLEASQPVNTKKPTVDEELCTLCGACAEACRFNAIIMGKSRIVIQEGLCHSCGGCALACPYSAIKEEKWKIGQVEQYSTSSGIRVISGRSEIGETSLVRIIKAVRGNEGKVAVSILDSPPGTSCALGASVLGSELCIAVTEPTEFGLHDLELLIEVLIKMGVDFAVLENKSGFGPVDIRAFCEDKGYKYLGSIPFSKEFFRSDMRVISSSALSKEVNAAYLAAFGKLLRLVGYERDSYTER